MSKPGQAHVKVMGGLPLALDQAGAYMEQTHCTLKDFLHLFNAYPVQLLSERDAHADHPFSVAKTFVEAFEKLQQEHAVAAQLLTLCCFLAPDEIPEVLFEHVHDRDLPLKEAVSHPLHMNAIFKELLAHSLIRRHAHNQTISVHRLVQVVLKERLPEVEQRGWNERVVRLLNQVIQLDVNQTHVEHQPLYELILPHALQCARQATHLHTESSDSGSLLLEVATYLFQRSRFQEAEPLYQQAISILQRHLEPTHADLVLALTRLGNIRHQLHRFQEAGASCECAACC